MHRFMIITSSIFILSALAFTDDIKNEDYINLLTEPIEKALEVRNAYAGLYRGHEFKPVPGLDNEDSVPFLKKILKEGLPDEKMVIKSRLAQCYAALCLGKIGDESVIEDLAAAVNTEHDKDSGGQITVKCVRAMGMIGTPKAKGEIYKILKSDERKRVRDVSIAVLGESINDKSDPYYEILKKISNEDENDDIKFAAGIAIERINIRIKEKEEKEKKEKEKEKSSEKNKTKEDN